jgi:hypothetical protein
MSFRTRRLLQAGEEPASAAQDSMLPVDKLRPTITLIRKNRHPVVVKKKGRANHARPKKGTKTYCLS